MLKKNEIWDHLISVQYCRRSSYMCTHILYHQCPYTKSCLELDRPGVCTSMMWPRSGKVYTSPLCQTWIVPFLGVLQDVFLDTVYHKPKGLNFGISCDQNSLLNAVDALLHKGTAWSYKSSFCRIKQSYRR